MIGKKIAIYVVAMMLFYSINSAAQLKCKIEYFSTENGLSHDAVTHVIKDKEGFMWFGTWNGINRFDGKNFVSYKSSPGDSSQLKNDRIDLIVEDGFNHLWLRGADNNVYRFEKATERFLNFSAIIQEKLGLDVKFGKIVALRDGTVFLISNDNNGLFHVSSGTTFTSYKKGLAAGFNLPSNTITFFYEDADNNVWIGGPNGLGLMVKTRTGEYRSARVPPSFKHLSYTAIREYGKNLYFGTADGMLVVYDKISKKLIYRKVASGYIHSVYRSKKSEKLYITTELGEFVIFDLPGDKHVREVLTAEPLFSIFEDSLGYLWVEPAKYGVIRVDPYNHTFKSLHQAIDRNTDVKTRFAVFEDINGRVWTSMKGGGFGFYDPALQKIEYFYNEPNLQGRQFSNVVYQLFYDKTGVLWLCTDDRGVNKIVFQTNNINQRLIEPNGKFKAQNEIRGLFPDRRNRLWVAAKSGRLNIYDQNKVLSDIFVNAPQDGIGAVYTMMEDRKGNIWLGTKANGLWKATPIDKKAEKYRLTHFMAGDNSLSSNQIYALLEDKKGRIWAGTFDNGLNLGVESGAVIRFTHKGPAFNRYPSNFKKIRSLALDPSENVWIGTTKGLLILETGGNYKYKEYSKVPGDRFSLGNNDVQYVFRDSRQRMWLGTSGGGLALAIGKKPAEALTFRNYTTREGLPNDFILSCVEDFSGNLWIATQNGLSKFDPGKNTFRNYDSSDGLPKTSFSEASCGRMTDGTLAFGTTMGYVFFNPELMHTQKVPANIVFTNLRVNNEDILTNGKMGLTRKNINYVSDIVLEHNQNIFSIDYATLDYRFSNKQEYAYRLKGFDKTWQNNKGLQRITYTNLPPGEYLLEVKNVNSEIHSNIPAKSMIITILPPPWRTWWAYLSYFIILSILFLVVRSTALTMLKLRHKIAVEQRLAALKVSFFTNISHELRTPLTLILNPIEEISRNENLSPQGMSYVEIVRKNANRMVRFINQLLDLRKMQSGKATLNLSPVEMVSFVKNTCEYFAEMARQKEITLEVESSDKELFALIDAEKVDIVIYNILANAFKFTPERKKIRLTINRSNADKLIISIHDQGPGVEDDKLQDIFELYYEGASKEGKNFKGTGIGLALSKELIELHHGRIFAENNSDKGLTIHVELTLAGTEASKEQPRFLIPSENMSAFSDVAPIAASSLVDHPTPSEIYLVLLVEDNDDLRAFLRTQLSEQYRVETACNGEEGFEKALQIHPDLILSDVMMPKMDGIQMLEKLRENVSTSHIPVVLLTAKSSIESQIEGLKYGADYYITKPFNNNFLMASIDNLIKRRKKVFDELLDKTEVIKLSPGEIVITSKDEVFLKKVIEIVENGMADPDFNIDAVAEMIGMGRTTFYKKFKSLTNLAPVEFVRDMRIQRGKQLLDAGENNISTVAYSIGFNNPKYFGTCFKEKYGITPSFYLKSLSQQ